MEMRNSPPEMTPEQIKATAIVLLHHLSSFLYKSSVQELIFRGNCTDQDEHEAAINMIHSCIDKINNNLKDMGLYTFKIISFIDKNKCEIVFDIQGISEEPYGPIDERPMASTFFWKQKRLLQEEINRSIKEIM